MCLLFVFVFRSCFVRSALCTSFIFLISRPWLAYISYLFHCVDARAYFAFQCLPSGVYLHVFKGLL